MKRVILLLAIVIVAVLAVSCAPGPNAAAGGGEGGVGGVESTSSAATKPPSGFKATRHRVTWPTREPDKNVSHEMQLRNTLNEIGNMRAEDHPHKMSIRKEGGDKTGDITNNVRSFILQLHHLQSIPQGLHPTADAVFQAADRAERVEHVNNFCQKNGFKPPNLRDNRNLIKWENAVKEIEKNRMTDEEYKYYKEEQAAVAKCKKEHAEELAEAARMEEEHDKITLAPMRAIVKFGMDATLTLFSAGIGGYIGPAISIGYSASTSDDPAKGGAVQAVVEVVTFGKSAPLNFITGKTGDAFVDGLCNVRERQQQRD